MREKKDKRITTPVLSLQALRALAFAAIFASHSGIAWNKWGGWGVSIFFVLSGFLMINRYYEKELSIAVKDSFRFAVGRIYRLYPLHLITMLAVAVIFLIENEMTTAKWRELFIKIALNVALVQDWVPVIDINVSLNGVAWYLSVSLFLYTMFPLILKKIRSYHTDKQAITAIIIVYVLLSVEL